MSLEGLARRNQADVNARLAAKGRCYMHNKDIPARYLLELPIGNVVPLCVECCAWWRKDAAESGDPWSQPVRITEIDDYPPPLRRPTGDTQ
jgi:hypothetical protein